MKIQYLGTAAAEGIPAVFCDCDNCKKTRQLGGKNIRTRSQALIDEKLLIDFPADTYMHYLKWNIPLSEIHACIITHSHSDHLYPTEISFRVEGFSHLHNRRPMTFYSARSGYEKLMKTVKENNIPEADVKIMQIEPFVSFEAEGYRITPVKASHDAASTPVIYAIEKGEKSILYAHDTSELCDESIAALIARKRAFSAISLDCTEANSPIVPYIGHLNLNKCTALKDEFIKKGIANENTIFVLNHFSHNGKDAVYSDFEKIAAKENFITSYDGMILNF